MLPLPNLDDRDFEQMLQDARKLIPNLLPEWTDENAHDPGVTLLELMSWLTELQQYYLNRVTEKNERKFLKLLGIEPLEPVSARAEVTFSGPSQNTVIPKGTPLLAAHHVFETMETVRLVEAVPDKVIVRTEGAAGGFTSNPRAGVAYYAFGAEAKKGSRLLIGLDRLLPEQQELKLFIRLSDDYPVPVSRGDSAGTNLVATASVAWSYAADEDSESWRPLEIVRDSTVHFSQSGELVFRLDAPMKAISFYPADDKKRYWLCCELIQPGYEIAPKIERLSLNTVLAAQQETLSESYLFDGTGEPGLTWRKDTHLAVNGSVLVQVQDGQGRWSDWSRTQRLNDCAPDAPCYEAVYEEREGALRLRFGDGVHGRIPPAGIKNIRLIAYKPEFEADRFLGRSSGLPEQAFEVPQQRAYLREGMRLQAGYRLRTGDWVWEDWEPVADLGNSAATDRHFVYDPGTFTVRFGNNEEGWIPPKSLDTPNLRWVALRSTEGGEGNVKQGMIRSFQDTDKEQWQGLAVAQAYPAQGGKDAESLQEAKLRARRESELPHRAVTAEDYEVIARATPGLRVARVKAIPLYRPGLKDYPKTKAPAQMTVVIVPYSERERPEAGQGFLETVSRHLDRHRLLATQVHVIPAAYVKVTVHAVVVVEPAVKQEQARFIKELKRLLRPMGHAEGAEGWPFGRSVYKGDIYGLISRMNGVVYVQDLWLDAEGTGIRKDGGGDIHIPPYSLVYSGEHEVELIGLNDL
ncbi:putative baseplate assembly protein [Paenibacillus sp. TAB 01]|uniref:putative baseplate assembly protein n=1 Tax=Paenibacillus sp. TAB 01 TaxID=3368988 RepID=UPI00375377DD